MKIIKTDNFDRDCISDVLIAENVNEYYGKFITGVLNKKYSGEHSPDFYRLVQDDYKLYKWEP